VPSFIKTIDATAVREGPATGASAEGGGVIDAGSAPGDPPDPRDPR
jgi:hypothetical protein